MIKEKYNQNKTKKMAVLYIQPVQYEDQSIQGELISGS